MLLQFLMPFDLFPTEKARGKPIKTKKVTYKNHSKGSEDWVSWEGIYTKLSHADVSACSGLARVSCVPLSAINLYLSLFF